jgi:hypothetical protein
MQVEHVMTAFVESAATQHSLPAMQRSQRKVVHQMAQAFSLATQSFGQEPDRHLRLLKVRQGHFPCSQKSCSLSLECFDSFYHLTRSVRAHGCEAKEKVAGSNLHLICLSICTLLFNFGACGSLWSCPGQGVKPGGFPGSSV